MPNCGTDRSLPSVPRSKGCLTCVTRKTRCDGRRPTCIACENRKQVCRGYRRQEFVFLSEGWRAPGVSSTARSKMKKSSSSDSTNQSALLSSDSPTLADLVLYNSPVIDRSHLHVAFFLASFGSRPCQAPAYIFTIFRHYFSLVSSNVLDSSKCSLSPSTPVVLAVDALAQAHFGMANADTVSVQRSFHSYGMALHSMSIRLSELTRGDSGLHDISEEDWQHVVFFCIVMMFWEMKMSPASRNWQNHIRGLAAAIILRGTDHAYSKTNIQLLAFSRLFIILQTLSARQPGFLSSIDWQQHSPISSAWLVEIKSTLEEAENLKISTDFELYTSIDSLMVDATIIVSIMAQFDKLLGKKSTVSGEDEDDHDQVLIDLYNTTESILSRNEARLAHWNRNIREVSLSSWPSLHQDVVNDPISKHFWSIIDGGDVQSYFDTVFSFRTMMEYHSVMLCWTTVMSLRLLLSDMLTYMIRTNAHGMPINPRQKIEDHRTQLMKYALNIIQTICYATLTENRAAAPFFFAAGFQLTIAVLERECKSLQAAGSNEDKIRRCESLKSLAVRYLDWAMQNKIPVKIDLHSFEKWEFESTV